MFFFRALLIKAGVRVFFLTACFYVGGGFATGTSPRSTSTPSAVSAEDATVQTEHWQLYVNANGCAHAALADHFTNTDRARWQWAFDGASVLLSLADGRQLYRRPGNEKWCYAALEGEDSNTDPACRTWAFDGVTGVFGGWLCGRRVGSSYIPAPPGGSAWGRAHGMRRWARPLMARTQAPDVGPVIGVRSAHSRGPASFPTTPPTKTSTLHL